MAPTRKHFFKVRKAANQNNSLLFSLPPELRNMIYEFVVADHVHLVQRKRTISEYAEVNPHFQLTTGPGLLLPCKQLYAEAINIYYSDAGFVVSIKHCPKGKTRDEQIVKAFRGFARKIGTQRARMVTKVGFGYQIDVTAQWNKGLGFNQADTIESAYKEWMPVARDNCPEFRPDAFRVMIEIFYRKKSGAPKSANWAGWSTHPCKSFVECSEACHQRKLAHLREKAARQKEADLQRESEGSILGAIGKFLRWILS